MKKKAPRLQRKENKKIQIKDTKKSVKQEQEDEGIYAGYGCPVPDDKLRDIPLVNLVPCRFHPILSKFPRGFLLFCGYSFAGGIATIVDLIVFYLWEHSLNLPYQWGVAVGYGCGMLTNFTLNKFLVFRNKSKAILSQFGAFCIVALIGLGLTYLLIMTFVEGLNMAPFAAKVVAVPIVLFWNFYGNKKATFSWFR